MDKELIALTLEPLDTQIKEAVKKAFNKMTVALDAMTVEYDAIFTQAITKEVCGDARALRLRISKVRGDGEKWKTKEKERYLKPGNAIQGLFNYLKKDTLSKEEKLKEVEEHFERKAQELINTKKTTRLKLLEPYMVDSTFVDLGNMTNEAWTAHFASIVTSHEKVLEDKKRNSAEQKIKDEQKVIFDSRIKILLPYGQFGPLIDLYHETTQEEFDTLLLEMKALMQEFNDKQEDLFEENKNLKEENKELKVLTPASETNKFKKDIFAGFSSGKPPTEKQNLASDKDTSLGEMLGFDSIIPIEHDLPPQPISPAEKLIKEVDILGRYSNTPEEKAVIQTFEDSIMNDLVIPESERMQKCIDYLSHNLIHFESETAKAALSECINSLIGASMIM